MTLHVYSARMRRGFVDPDALDITRQGADRAREQRRAAPGEPFAPSWGLLRPALESLRFAAAQREQGREHLADVTAASVWSSYRIGFAREMRFSYREHRDAWDALLSRDRVVLVCFCAEPERCHRFLLRAEILPALGAVDCGEMGGAP